MPVRVAIAGVGSIGWKVITALDAGIEGLSLTAVSGRDPEATTQRVAALRSRPPVRPLAELAELADVVVECLPPAAFRDVAWPALDSGRVLVTASVGALMDNGDLVDLARRKSGRIMVPSGAVVGLDGLRAGAEAGLETVRLVTRKPPRAFGAEVAVDGKTVATDSIRAPVCLFTGNAREAIARFPANVNVAAAISLAGLGPDRTSVEIWADPGVERNQHRLIARSVCNEMETQVINLPDPDNPRTSGITAYSIVAVLKRLVDPVSVGT